MNTLLLLCLQIKLFALISPISGQDETEVNQNDGADYQNNGYIGDGDNYDNNENDYQNNGDTYQNNGADYRNNNNQNNGLDYQNEGENPLNSKELQHLQDMRQETAALNRRLKPPLLRNTPEEFKSESLDLELDKGEQPPRQTTRSPDPTFTTTDTTITTSEIQTTSSTPTTNTSHPTAFASGYAWSSWEICERTKGKNDCKRKRWCLPIVGNDQRTPPTCSPPGVEDSANCDRECPPECNEWGPWISCKEANVGSAVPLWASCERERMCKDNGKTNEKMSDWCPRNREGTCGTIPCKSWWPWNGCSPNNDGSKCVKYRACDDGGGQTEFEECTGVPPKCGNNIDKFNPTNGNCTEYDYKDCGPTCLRCGCCIEPAGYVGVGEYGCEPCTGGSCEPVAIP